ncbi:hypothetical protein D1818_01910 [Aquimarina sp. BL5]|uniref:hypothetical protein n=1 Tax=Aquimarina sp. BL5 TaxID=1714860 RepID=UPI000E524510|nr:hypothetical protein [Aquimarina sp. BL5]AXT49635.1 hypothetical protein D1818_01910 [Aquimarina sp. BL5]RKN00127.1 hypothetical protein D7036_19350 [Aquimarina sp. BL5]
MKKVFLLPRGLDKFSSKELKNMEAILGGTIDVPVEIYYPTSGGRRCADGQVWSETLQKCVPIVIGVPIERR